MLLIPFDRLPPTKTKQLFDLANDCWQASHSYYILGERLNRYDHLNELEADLKKSKVYVLYDHKNDKIAASIQFNTKYKGKEAYFGTLCVAKEYQGKGLAERLIKHVEAKSVKAGHQKLYILVVALAEKLKNFYKRLGFHESGHIVKRDEAFLKRVKQVYVDKVHFQEMIKVLGSPLRARL